MKEVSTSGVKLTREPSGQYSDFNILSSLNSQVSCSLSLSLVICFLCSLQICTPHVSNLCLFTTKLFESSAMMHVSAVKSLLSALRQLSHQCIAGTLGGFGQGSSQKIGSISFSVERMISILVSNLHSTY